MNKRERIAELTRQFSTGGIALDPRYAGYFVLFNQQQYYEAHDVLEDLWLADRQGPNGNFYKGLIQLAGAFVHLQKRRLQPSAALFKLAQKNLEPYSTFHEHLDVAAVQQLIASWLDELHATAFHTNPLDLRPAPRIQQPA